MKFWLWLLVLAAALPTRGQAVYPRIEASFTVNSLGSANPYDFTQVDIRVQIRQPDGSVISLPAFYDGGTTWRVRHAPTITGTYAIQGVTLNGSPLAVGNLQPTNWVMTGFPALAGYVRVDPGNPRRFITSDGRRFFPMGHDAAWDINSSRTVASILPKMGGTRENWSRIWMDDWDGKNLDWGYTNPPLGRLNLTVARKWDTIVSAAEQAGVHFQMTLQHHGQYSSTTDAEWPGNPYNLANGGFLSDATQFFTNATAIKYTEQKLRYAVARWGCSPAIMAWELFNEVQFTDAGQNGDWSIIAAWHNQMAAFLRAQDAYHHLITTSSDLTKPIWDSTDYYTHHDYPNDLIDDIWGAPTISASQPVAPVFGSECGMDFTPHLGETPTAFAGLLAGQSGAEQIWYWDVIDTNNDYVAMQSAADFAALSGLGGETNLGQSQVTLSTAQAGPLTFSFGGGWSAATQSVFTIGPYPPAAVAGAPAYLQGSYHHDMTSNGYTFLVNYPAAGTFSAQVIETASSGAGLAVWVDHARATNVAFPSAAGDISTNFVLTLSLPAGAHTIMLTNGGLDWIELGNITLNPYVPLLGGFDLSNQKFAAAWMWNRTNVYAPNPAAAVSSSFVIGGLEPGDYDGEWWDAAAGRPLGGVAFHLSAGASNVTETTPPILRSAALFIGHPPRAQVSAGPVTLTLGTNAPWTTRPLWITNAGGLPLGYGLAFENVSPLVYSAIRSTQAGGPWYAWKDISGVGIDLATNLAPLTSKSARDEGMAGPINLGFAFPFYDGEQEPGLYGQIYVSPNGFIAFSPFGGDTSSNTILPGAAAPSNVVALYWCDLKAGPSAHIYAAADPVGQTFTVQYQNMTPNEAGGGAISGQIILKSTGEIALQYQAVGGQTNVTVGAQNAERNLGLTAETTAARLSPGEAILITPAPWLRVNRGGGLAAGGEAVNAGLGFTAQGMRPGTYQADVVVKTNFADAASVPVTLKVAPAPLAMTTGVGGGDFQAVFQAASGVTCAVETATNVSGPWEKGDVTPTVRDNGDGSETVTLTAPLSSQAEFLRVTVSNP